MVGQFSSRCMQPRFPKGLTVKLDILAHHGSSGLVLLVEGDVDHAALDGPAADVLDKLVKGLAVEVEPRLENGAVDALHGLADDDGHADAHELLEARDIGDQVGVKVVAVQRRPELVVRGTDELAVQGAELLYGLGKRVGGGVWGEDVRREESEAQAEVGRGEDGQRLDQDVGDGLIAAEVGVELVAGWCVSTLLQLAMALGMVEGSSKRGGDQIELIM